MKLLVVILLSCSFVFSHGNYDDRSYKVSPGGTLDIDLTSADIIINTWNRNEVMLRAEEDEGLKLAVSPNRVVIRSGYHNHTSTLIVNIPAHFNIKIRTSAGDHIINGNIRGNLDLINSGGDITFNDVNGSVNIKSGGGDIFGHDVSGSVSVESNGGNISFAEIKGRTSVKTGAGDIKISSSRLVDVIKSTGGNLQIKEAAGNGVISTGAGNVDIGYASGNLKINSSGGDVRINETKGKIDVKTSGGIIRIKQVMGSITAFTQSGDIYIYFTSRAQNSSAISANGDIRAAFEGNLKASLKAKMKDHEIWRDESNPEGPVKSDFRLSSLQRNKGRQEVMAVYELNGGSSSVRISLEAKSGDIIIKKGS